jgi:hypothetical protein
MLDNRWYIPISIGTPPQTLLLTPDLSAPDLTVESTLIDSSMRGNVPIYNPSASTSAIVLSGYNFDQQYANGKAYSGVYIQDTAKVGGLTLSNFVFQAANTTNTKITGSPNGIFGMNTDPHALQVKPEKIPRFFRQIMNYLNRKSLLRFELYLSAA